MLLLCVGRLCQNADYIIIVLWGTVGVLRGGSGVGVPGGASIVLGLCCAQPIDSVFLGLVPPKGPPKGAHPLGPRRAPGC
jgi:hypothetical protein